MNRLHLWVGLLAFCMTPAMGLAGNEKNPSTRPSAAKESPLARKVAKLLKEYRMNLAKEGNRNWTGRRRLIAKLGKFDLTQLTSQQLQGVVQVFSLASRDMWLIMLQLSAACSQLRKAPPPFKKRMIRLWVQHLRDKDANVRQSASSWCLRRMGIAASVKEQLSKAAPSKKTAPTSRQAKP